MRTLSAELTAAQRAKPVQPYVKAVVTDGTTTYTFDNQGYSGADKRITGIEHTEQPFGGSATIRLHNADKYFATKNLKGWEVTLSWGAKVDGTYESSSVAPLFVFNQRDTSEEGVLITELQCFDLWWIIANTLVVNAGKRLTGTIASGEDFNLGETITGSVSNATGVLVGIGNSSIIVTSVSGTFQASENATGATGACNTLTAVDTVIGAGGTDYGRSTTILNIIKAIVPPDISDVILDSDDGNDAINTYMPLLVTEIGTNARFIIRQLLQMSECVGRIENDSNLHILYPDPAADADYTYQTDHVFWYQLRERAVILPNKVLFVNHMPGSLPDGVEQYHGTAQDNDSVTLLGELGTIQVNTTIESDADAERLAAAWIAQRVVEAYQGAVRAPMNCGQELYDQVSVVDSRSGVTVTGRVGKITRRYLAPIDTANHAYEIELSLGGGIIPESGIPDEDLGTGVLRIDTPWWQNLRPQWETVLPKAIQGYQTKVTFSATSRTAVEWTADKIKFYDGTEQNISSGNYNLPDSTIRYIYFDLDDDNPGTLKTTTDYTSVMTQNTGLLCLIQKGSVAGIDATVIPSYGKQPLITPDIIQMTGLKEYSYADGTKLQGLFSTQVQAGYIHLSAETSFASGYDPTGKELIVHRGASAPVDTSKLWFDTTNGIMKGYDGGWKVLEGEWYNKSGVCIDATQGINIYGTNMAFVTRATKTGTAQCYMGSDGAIYAGAGAVKLNASGIRIKGATLYLFNAAGTNAALLTVDTDGSLNIGGKAGTKMNLMNAKFVSSGHYDLGDSSYYFGDVHAKIFRPRSNSTYGGIILGTLAKAETGNIKYGTGTAHDLYIYGSGGWDKNA